MFFFSFLDFEFRKKNDDDGVVKKNIELRGTEEEIIWISWDLKSTWPLSYFIGSVLHRSWRLFLACYPQVLSLLFSRVFFFFFFIYIILMDWLVIYTTI